MSEIFDMPFRKVIEVSASKSPTPGGGSVSAMSACFGAAMLSMVGNLTTGKEKYQDVEADIQSILKKLDSILKELEVLVEKDINDFNNFMTIIKMPKETEEQKQQKENLKQKALKDATDTPLKIAKTCLEGLKIAKEIALIGNKGAISDVGVGAYVLESALNSVLLSVDINLPSIKDELYKQNVIKDKDKIVNEAKEILNKTIEVVQQRINQ
ncbi:cyclodeaminase/cyclohydrolase family protein [Bacillota bacterium LX-D]|nr:cyclodeaminase/cyclohydrolase family protein [Bacillota bacterium LX-D]